MPALKKKGCAFRRKTPLLKYKLTKKPFGQCGADGFLIKVLEKVFEVWYNKTQGRIKLNIYRQNGVKYGYSSRQNGIR